MNRFRWLLAVAGLAFVFGTAAAARADDWDRDDRRDRYEQREQYREYAGYGYRPYYRRVWDPYRGWIVIYYRPQYRGWDRHHDGGRHRGWYKHEDREWRERDDD